MAGRTILIVEDETDIRDVLRQSLELEGYEVAAAANGREGLEWLRSNPLPALVLLDLLMPVMNGAELLSLVRGDEALRAVPVVVVSAFGSLAAGLTSETQGRLPKPLDLDQLLAVVARFASAPAGDERPPMP